MSSDAVMQKLETLEQKLDRMEQKMNGKGQPDKYLKIHTQTGPSEPVQEIIQETKKGERSNGLRTSQVRSILRAYDYDYSSEGTRGVMQRLEREFTQMVYKSRVGAKGSKLVWDPSKEKEIADDFT